MKKTFFSPTLVAAVVTTFPISAFAIDAWDYSGQEARANAQQLDYFSLRDDVGNVWVNPALLMEHGSQVRLTIDNRNRQNIYRVDDNLNPGGSDNGGGAGGLFYRLTSNSMVGAYIGRRSNSDFRSALDFDGYGAPSLTGRAGNFSSDLRPDNQFDLFYALSLPAVDLGLRLNYQAYERQTTDPTIFGFEGDAGSFSGITSAQYVEQLNQQAGAHAADIDVNLAAEMGTYEDFEQRSLQLTRKATELNAALGFSIPTLRLDGAIQIGNASGTQRNDAYEHSDYQQWTRLTGSEEDVLLDRGEASASARDQVSVDDGRSLGVALRYQVFERDSDALMLAFNYQDIDYSGVLSNERSRQLEAVSWVENDTNTEFEQSERRTEESTERWSGSANDERQTLALIATYQLQPRIGTRVTVSTGFVKQDMSFGTGLIRDEDFTEVQREEGAGSETVTQTVYNNTYGVTDWMSFDVETTRVPLVVALEQDLTERWALRGSISRDIYDRSDSEMVTYRFDGLEMADRRTPEADDLDQSTQSGPDRYVQSAAFTRGNQMTWDDQETTVRIGVGYRRNNFSIDGVLSASLDRLFTADHKVLEDSKFARVTVGYHF